MLLTTGKSICTAQAAVLVRNFGCSFQELPNQSSSPSPLSRLRKPDGHAKAQPQQNRSVQHQPPVTNHHPLRHRLIRICFFFSHNNKKVRPLQDEPFLIPLSSGKENNAVDDVKANAVYRIARAAIRCRNLIFNNGSLMWCSHSHPHFLKQSIARGARRHRTGIRSFLYHRQSNFPGWYYAYSGTERP